MTYMIYITIYKFIIVLLFIYIYLQNKDKSLKISWEKNQNTKINKLVEENFFIIESNNLEEIDSHMYGFSISEKGILTDNYFKNVGYNEEVDPRGTYILIRRKGNIIRIEQDYYGSFGIFTYKNEDTGYFALSNSFLLLVEKLLGKYTMTFNKDFSDSFIISGYASFSTYETLIKEINKIEPNSFITINIIQKKYEIEYIDQKQNTIPFESQEGLKLIDKWVDRWGYIIRSLNKKTNSISMDLSGGFDTRTTFSVLYNSGIDLNNIYIKSFTDSLHTHIEDFKIATNISSKFGFKLNQNQLDDSCIIWDLKNSLDCTMYTKLGFHKQYYFKTKFFNKPRFYFNGAWGEMLRGYPNIKIKNYIENIISKAEIIKGSENEFYNSSKRFINRSINMIKNEKQNNSDYELSMKLFLRSLGIYHFGKASIESFIANIYQLPPLADPDLKKLNMNFNEQTYHDLIAYIYVRFAYDLIYISFDSKRYLNKASIEKAEELNKKIPPYKIKSDYNKNFYIDNERKFPLFSSKKEPNPKSYLKRIFEDKKYFFNFNKIYNNNVYDFAVKYSQRTKYFPLSHEYGLLAIAKILDYLSLNEIKLKDPK